MDLQKQIRSRFSLLISLLGCPAFCGSIPGQQLQRPSGIGSGKHRSSPQHPHQIPERMQSVLLHCFNQTESHRIALRAARCTGKQKILSIHDERLYTSLGAVVGDLRPSVFQIPDQPGPLLLQIVQRFSKGGVWQRCLCAAPRQQCVKNRFCPFLPPVPFFRCQFSSFLLQSEQRAAVSLTFQGRTGCLFLFGYSLECLVEFSSGMRPASHYADLLWQAVVAAISIRMQPPGKTLRNALALAALRVALYSYSTMGWPASPLVRYSHI